MHDDGTETGDREIRYNKFKKELIKNTTQRQEETNEKNDGFISNLFTKIRTYCTPEKYNNKQNNINPPTKPVKDKVKFKPGDSLATLIMYDPKDPVILINTNSKIISGPFNEDKDKYSRNIEITHPHNNVCSACSIF